ncbi:class I SAM-dependent methyltransferase [Humibacter sp. RRB41]|uniref:class I SAM-dependent methyltransferase n=1 Tax=Humibacter sp. RRB41 TaxID=2919946 RepID=UPI001FA9AD6D|nr:class I SAM-dependent methyltransferase [Humibacter sp. RRB41]
MSFDVDADAYDRFMGRYSEPLAMRMLETITLPPAGRVLDVGAGTGAVTALLVRELQPSAVTAVDPSSSFVDALRQRFPEVEVERASAESLPFADGAFELTIAQLVVNFMSDPVAGLSEMARVTRPGCTVAASVWDFAGARAPLSLFWRVARQFDEDVIDESALPGAREGHLLTLFRAAGLRDVSCGQLTVEVPYADPEDWWRPYTLGVGPAGSYLAGLDVSHREALRRRAVEEMGDVTATAWFAVGAA